MYKNKNKNPKVRGVHLNPLNTMWPLTESERVLGEKSESVRWRSE